MITFNLIELDDNNYPLMCTDAKKGIKLQDIKQMQRRCMGEAPLIVEWLFCLYDLQVNLDDVATSNGSSIAWRKDYMGKRLSQILHIF